MGEEGQHARFSVISGGASARAVAFGCEDALGDNPAAALDAAFRLERNVWNGAVEPRLVLRHSRPCSAGRIDVIGEPADGEYLAAAFSELGQALADTPLVPAGDRVVVDRRGESPLAVLADAISCSEPVLAVCSDVARRLRGLAERAGGFALVSYHTLGREPALARGHASLVALDPPSSPVPGSCCAQVAGSSIWRGARLSYALLSRCMSWSTVSALNSPPSTEA